MYLNEALGNTRFLFLELEVSAKNSNEIRKIKHINFVLKNLQRWASWT